MSDTPLTDAHVRQLADGLAHPHWVAFARGLERDNQVLREEVKHQAICNGAGGSRELALRTTIAELQRENAALESLIIKAGYIITNFNGEMALCRDPWHQPKEEQP